MVQLWELEEFQPPVFLEFVRNLLPIPTYQGNTFLPVTTIDDIEFEYIRGWNNRPVMAQVIGWDSEAPIGGRQVYQQKVKGELPPIKRKYRISEKEIIRYMAPRRGTADQNAAIDAVYNLTEQLVRSTQARIEWLQLQALSEPTLVYNEGGVIIEFDYGLNKTLQIDLTTNHDAAGTDRSGEFTGTWSDVTNSNPIQDLLNLCLDAELKTGERPQTMVLSRKAYQYLLINKKIMGWVYNNYQPQRPLLPEELQSILTRYNLPQLQTYDVWVDQENPDGTLTTVRTMADNKAFLLPALPVGKTLWGPTAESRVLLGTGYAQAAPGLWANTYAKDEPPSQWTKTAAVSFPSLPDSNKLVQMTLFAAETG